MNTFVTRWKNNLESGKHINLGAPQKCSRDSETIKHRRLEAVYSKTPLLSKELGLHGIAQNAEAGGLRRALTWHRHKSEIDEKKGKRFMKEVDFEANDLSMEQEFMLKGDTAAKLFFFTVLS